MPSPSLVKPTSRVFWLLFTAALTLATAGAVFLLTYDIAPPEAKDMTPRKSLATASGQHANPLADFFVVLQEHPLSLPSPGSPRPRISLTSESLSQNRERALRAFEALMLTDPATWHWPTGAEGKAPTDIEAGYAQHLQLLMPLANLVRVQASLLAEEKPDQSLRLQLDFARFAHHLQDAGGVLLHHMVASALLRTTLLNMERTLVQHPWTPAELGALQKQVEALETTRTAYAETLRAEYQFAAAMYRKAKTDKTLAVDLPKLNQRGYPEPLRGMMLKPNLTLAARLDLQRAVQQGLLSNWREAIDAAEGVHQEVEEITRDPFRFWFNPNTTGLGFALVDASDFAERLHAEAGKVAVQRQLVLQLALRRYELDRHSLPDDLGKLVPAYVPTVPLDPFTNTPMRWSHSTQTLYSVGADGVDQGGRYHVPGEVSPKQMPLDIGQPYWWGTAGREARDAQRLAPPEQTK